MSTTLSITTYIIKAGKLLGRKNKLSRSLHHQRVSSVGDTGIDEVKAKGEYTFEDGSSIVISVYANWCGTGQNPKQPTQGV